MIIPRPYEAAGWFLAAMAVLGFFLPWLKHDRAAEYFQQTPQAAVQELVEERPWWQEQFAWRQEEWRAAFARPTEGISGYQLVLWLRSRAPEQLAKASVATFLPGPAEAPERGLIVLAFPGLALLSACILSLRWRVPLVLLVPTAGCALLYYLSRSRINDTYFERLVSNAQVGLGYWLALYALLGLAILLLVRLIVSMAQR
jgi:hypothetical protein